MGKSWSQPQSPVPQVRVPPMSPVPVEPRLAQPELGEGAMEPTAATSDFQKDVFHALECPVCLEIAIPPVTLCKLGHFICGICRKKVARCVICRVEYTELRCYAVENIASKINVKCRYKPCETTQSIAKLEEHLERCEYRPVICNCNITSVCVNKPIEYDKFVAHLKESHGAISATGLSDIVIPDWIKKVIVQREDTSLPWGNTLYAYDGVSFILNMAIEDTAVFFWVSGMLPESQGSKYVADIHIGKRDIVSVGKVNCDTKNIKWTVGVVPVHVTLNDMKESGDCIAFPASRLIAVSGTKPEEIGSFSVFVELKIRKL